MKEKESMTRTGKKIVCICMILSLILTCILCVTPVTAKAAEEETPERVVRVGSFEDTFNMSMRKVQGRAMDMSFWKLCPAIQDGSLSMSPVIGPTVLKSL